MAYKFQLGAAIVSGSLTRDAGDLAIRNHANVTKAAISASSGNAQFEGTVSGAAGSFDAITGVSLALQSGGITAAGSIAGASTIAASGLASLDGGINVDDNFTVSTAGAVVAVGVAAGGAITTATDIDGSGDLTMGTITMTGMSVDADGDLVAKTVVGTTTVRATTELSGATLNINNSAMSVTNAGLMSGSALSIAGNLSASFGQIFSTNLGTIHAPDMSASLDLLAGQDVKANRDISAARDLLAGRNLSVGGTTRIGPTGNATLATTTVTSLSSSGDLEVVGNSFLGGTFNVSGAVKLAGITADTAMVVADDGLFFNDGRDGTVKNVNISSFVNDIAGTSLEMDSNQMRIAASAAGPGLSGGGAVALALDINELAAATVNVAADSIAIVDADDSNGSKKESIADFVDAIAGTGLTATNGVLSTEGGSAADVSDGGTLAEGYNFLTGAAGGTFNLPVVTGDIDSGSRIVVKNGSAGVATIVPFAANTVDGAASIVLESPYAAVTLVVSATSGSWALV